MTTRQMTLKSNQVKQLQEAQSDSSESKILSLQREIEQLDVKATALNWRAMRSASMKYLHLFSKIGSGDLDQLLAAIEDERVKKEEKAEQSTVSAAASVNGAGDEIKVEETEVEIKADETVGENAAVEEKEVGIATPKRARSEDDKMAEDTVENSPKRLKQDD